MRDDRWSIEMMRKTGEAALRARRTGGTEELASLILAGGLDPDSAASVGLTFRVSADWAESAFPLVRLSPGLGESFMATRIPADVLPELIAPWRTMVIELPPNTLVAHDLTPGNGWTETEFINWVVLQNEPGPKGHADMGTQSTHAAWRVWPVTSAAGIGAVLKIRSMKEMAWQAENLKAQPGDCFGEKRQLDVTGRDSDIKLEAVQETSRMLVRFVVGCILELDRERPRIEKEKRLRRGKFARKLRRGREPQSWVFKLTREVVVNCREFVTEASRRGEKCALTVQSLVRGHWKNQPCGPGGKDRKFIHIEPYWRGPEDAPIAVRPHILKGRPEDTAQP